MNPESTRGLCPEWRDDLLRLACGDWTEPPSALQSHLAACAGCRAELVALSRTTDSCRAALAPEPLSAALTAEIRRRMDSPSNPRHRTVQPWLGLACLAAAAGLLLALLWPRVATQRPAARDLAPDALELSQDDAAAVLAASVLLDWDGPVDYLASQLNDRVDQLSRRLERAADARTCLPWDPNDDWDLPTPPADSSAIPRPGHILVLKPTFSPTGPNSDVSLFRRLRLEQHHETRGYCS